MHHDMNAVQRTRIETVAFRRRKQHFRANFAEVSGFREQIRRAWFGNRILRGVHQRKAVACFRVADGNRCFVGFNRGRFVPEQLQHGLKHAADEQGIAVLLHPTMQTRLHGTFVSPRGELHEVLFFVCFHQDADGFFGRERPPDHQTASFGDRQQFGPVCDEFHIFCSSFSFFEHKKRPYASRIGIHMVLLGSLRFKRSGTAPDRIRPGRNTLTDGLR